MQGPGLLYHCKFCTSSFDCLSSLFLRIIQMYTIQKSKEYDERRKRDEETEIKMRRGGEESKREKYGGRPGGNFLNEIEKTALSSSTVQGRIAARKVTRDISHATPPPSPA